MKLLLPLILLTVATAAYPLQADLGKYQADMQAWQQQLDRCRETAKVLPQKQLNRCRATEQSYRHFKQALASSLYTCDGLNFDAQQPGQLGRRLAAGLYRRYCSCAISY
jgi:hypothetical protein